MTKTSDKESVSAPEHVLGEKKLSPQEFFGLAAARVRGNLKAASLPGASDIEEQIKRVELQTIAAVAKEGEAAYKSGFEKLKYVNTAILGMRHGAEHAPLSSSVRPYASPYTIPDDGYVTDDNVTTLLEARLAENPNINATRYHWAEGTASLGADKVSGARKVMLVQPTEMKDLGTIFDGIVYNNDRPLEPLLIPVNVGKNHWVMAYMEPVEAEGFVLGETRPKYNLTFVDPAAEKPGEGFVSQGFMGVYDGLQGLCEITGYRDLSARQQGVDAASEGHLWSCGLWCVELGEALAAGASVEGVQLKGDTGEADRKGAILKAYGADLEGIRIAAENQERDFSVDSFTPSSATRSDSPRSGTSTPRVSGEYANNWREQGFAAVEEKAFSSKAKKNTLYVQTVDESGVQVLAQRQSIDISGYKTGKTDGGLVEITFPGGKKGLKDIDVRKLQVAYLVEKATEIYPAHAVALAVTESLVSERRIEGRTAQYRKQIDKLTSVVEETTADKSPEFMGRLQQELIAKSKESQKTPDGGERMLSPRIKQVKFEDAQPFFTRDAMAETVSGLVEAEKREAAAAAAKQEVERKNAIRGTIAGWDESPAKVMDERMTDQPTSLFVSTTEWSEGSKYSYGLARELGKAKAKGITSYVSHESEIHDTFGISGSKLIKAKEVDGHPDVTEVSVPYDDKTGVPQETYQRYMVSRQRQLVADEAKKVYPARAIAYNAVIKASNDAGQVVPADQYKSMVDELTKVLDASFKAANVEFEGQKKQANLVPERDTIDVIGVGQQEVIKESLAIGLADAMRESLGNLEAVLAAARAPLWTFLESQKVEAAEIDRVLGRLPDPSSVAPVSPAPKPAKSQDAELEGWLREAKPPVFEAISALPAYKKLHKEREEERGREKQAKAARQKEMEPLTQAVSAVGDEILQANCRFLAIVDENSSGIPHAEEKRFLEFALGRTSGAFEYKTERGSRTIYSLNPGYDAEVPGQGIGDALLACVERGESLRQVIDTFNEVVETTIREKELVKERKARAELEPVPSPEGAFSPLLDDVDSTQLQKFSRFVAAVETQYQHHTPEQRHDILLFLLDPSISEQRERKFQIGEAVNASTPITKDTHFYTKDFKIDGEFGHSFVTIHAKTEPLFRLLRETTTLDQVAYVIENHSVALQKRQESLDNALAAAVIEGSVEKAGRLIAAGASPRKEISDEEGRSVTVEHLAVLTEKPEMIKAIVNSGSITTDSENLTPGDYAKGLGMPLVSERGEDNMKNSQSASFSSFFEEEIEVAPTTHDGKGSEGTTSSGLEEKEALDPFVDVMKVLDDLLKLNPEEISKHHPGVATKSTVASGLPTMDGRESEVGSTLSTDRARRFDRVKPALEAKVGSGKLVTFDVTRDNHENFGGVTGSEQPPVDLFSEEVLASVLTSGSPVRLHESTSTTEMLGGLDYVPLMCAAEVGDSNEVQRLLASGLDINHPEYGTGDTLLHKAARNGQAAMVTFLLEQPGICVTLKNSNEETPQMVASDPKIKGAIVETDNNNTTLCLTVYAGIDTIQQDIQAIKNINAVIDAGTGDTFLHALIKHGSVDGVNALLAVRDDVDVNIRNFAGDTPAHVAAKTGHIKAIPALITANADMGLRDANDRTAADIVGARSVGSVTSATAVTTTSSNIDPSVLSVARDLGSGARGTGVALHSDSVPGSDVGGDLGTMVSSGAWVNRYMNPEGMQQYLSNIAILEASATRAAAPGGTWVNKYMTPEGMADYNQSMTVLSRMGGHSEGRGV